MPSATVAAFGAAMDALREAGVPREQAADAFIHMGLIGHIKAGLTSVEIHERVDDIILGIHVGNRAAKPSA